jgi:DNA-binding transcriptional MocR family regulator
MHAMARETTRHGSGQADGLRYRRLAEALRAGMRVGTFPAGSRLPSLRALAAGHGVGMNTAIAAYRALAAEGLVLALPRSGFRAVAPRADPAPRTPEALEAAAPVDMGEFLARSRRLHELPGVANLAVAVPPADLLPLRDLRRAHLRILRAHGVPWDGYEAVGGCAELRLAIAQRLARAGAAVASDEVVVTNGAQEGLHLALSATSAPGACVAVESPAYPGLIQAIGALGLTCVEIPSSSTTGMSVEALRLALDDHRISAVLCTATYSNPAGGSIPAPARLELISLVRERGIALIDDDTYGDCAHDGARPRPLLADDRSGTVVHVGSFSKSLSPALRLGFLCAGRWRARAEAAKIAMNIGTAALPQLAVAGLLSSGDYDRHLQRAAPLLRERMGRCAEAVLRGFPAGTRVSRPQGGMVLWVELPAGVDAELLCQDGARARIAIAPGTLFSPRRRYRRHVRLCGARWDARIAEAIAHLGRLAAHQRARRR